MTKEELEQLAERRLQEWRRPHDATKENEVEEQRAEHVLRTLNVHNAKYSAGLFCGIIPSMELSQE
jgi:hypothetical protein